MTAEIIDGKALAKKVRNQIKEKVKKLKPKPGLAVILIGNDPASEIYIRNKEKACKEAGIYTETHKLNEDIQEIEVLNLVAELNKNKKIHGILIQLPLPKNLNEKLIVGSILPDKDVDGFHVVNLGNLMQDNNVLVPATPKGIMKLIESTGQEIAGKHAVIVGRSNTVGKPIAHLLLQKNATVTICHSKSQPLGGYTKNADIIVAAVGKANLIKKEMVKEGAIVIDVGINRIGSKVIGDVAEDVKEIASYITPVPGGVGPMTIAMLLDNTLQAYDFLR